MKLVHWLTWSYQTGKSKWDYHFNATNSCKLKMILHKKKQTMKSSISAWIQSSICEETIGW